MIMRFKNDKAAEQLLEKGEVATLRGTLSQKSGRVLVVAKGQKLPAYRHFMGAVYIGKARPGDSRLNVLNTPALEAYVDISGFASVEEWLEAAREFGTGWFHLFLVTLLGRS